MNMFRHQDDFHVAVSVPSPGYWPDINGMPWTLVIVLVVVGIFHFVTTKTVLGRHIYALGGNPEAAELTVSASRKSLTLCSARWAAGGPLRHTIRFPIAICYDNCRALFEMDAIAAAYVGGVSAAGGVGKVLGSIIGALVMMSLTSGMNLMTIDISLQYIVRGAVLAAAVIFDVTTRTRGK